MEKIEKIKSWLEGDQDYIEGVELYNAHAYGGRRIFPLKPTCAQCKTYLKAELESILQRAEQEEEARVTAEKEAQVAAEEEARLAAEEEARLASEEEARLASEEEARLTAEEEAKAKPKAKPKA